MKKIICYLLFVFTSSSVYSWSIDGHILIADYAADGLTPAERRHFESIARKLETTFDTDDRLFLIRNYDSASDLAKIAGFPDRVRNQNLDELFAQWQLEVPQPLAHLAEMNSSNWHYKNIAYYSGADEAPQCDIADPINIASILPLLMESYDQADDEVAKAILLSFIIHMVADAHQPMHAISRVDSSCEHDLGGNRFCVIESRVPGRCDENLHSLWDGGVGLFDRVDTYPLLYAGVRENITSGDIDDLRPDSWLMENYDYARLIYSIRENQAPDNSYIADGQNISVGRIMLAAARLTAILKELY